MPILLYTKKKMISCEDGIDEARSRDLMLLKNPPPSWVLLSFHWKGFLDSCATPDRILSTLRPSYSSLCLVIEPWSLGEAGKN